MEIRFYEKVEDSLLKFAVIIAKYKGKYVFCKHKARNTLEILGGHREKDELINKTAYRELQEETGAIDFEIKRVCVYSVAEKDNSNVIETFGMLYYANIKSFGLELHSEIETVVFMSQLTDNLTYPNIQPKLIEEAQREDLYNCKKI